jgi:hypothetical protein
VRRLANNAASDITAFIIPAFRQRVTIVFWAHRNQEGSKIKFSFTSFPSYSSSSLQSFSFPLPFSSYSYSYSHVFLFCPLFLAFFSLTLLYISIVILLSLLFLLPTFFFPTYSYFLHSFLSSSFHFSLIFPSRLNFLLFFFSPSSYQTPNSPYLSRTEQLYGNDLYKVLPQHVNGQTEENHDTHSKGRKEQQNSQVQVREFHYYKKQFDINVMEVILN